MKRYLIVLLLIISFAGFSQTTPGAVRRVDNSTTIFITPLSNGSKLEDLATGKSYRILRAIAGTNSLLTLVLGVDYLELQTTPFDDQLRNLGSMAFTDIYRFPQLNQSNIFTDSLRVPPVAYGTTWKNATSVANRGDLWTKLESILGTFGSYLPLAGGNLSGYAVFDASKGVTFKSFTHNFNLYGHNASNAFAIDDGTMNRISIDDNHSDLISPDGYGYVSVANDFATSSKPIKILSIPHAITDIDRFLKDSAGILKYRTGAEIISDLGVIASGTETDPIYAVWLAKDPVVDYSRNLGSAASADISQFVQAETDPKYAADSSRLLDKTGMSFQDINGAIAVSDSAYDATIWSTSKRLPTKMRLKALFDLKEPTITAGAAGQYWDGNKTWQTLPASSGTVTGTGVAGYFPIWTGASSLDSSGFMKFSEDYYFIRRTNGSVGFYLSSNNSSAGIFTASNKLLFDAGGGTRGYVNSSKFNINAGLTYQIAEYSIISDSINNGVTLHAPSQNAVFDALAGKEPTITTGTDLQYWRGDKTWQTLPASGGTVTSVAMTVPTGLDISGTPITTSGTFGLTLTSGYAIPTTANISTWNGLVTFPGLGETSTTAYRGDRGKTAYDYSQIGHLPLTGGAIDGDVNFKDFRKLSFGNDGTSDAYMEWDQATGQMVYLSNGYHKFYDISSILQFETNSTGVNIPTGKTYQINGVPIPTIYEASVTLSAAEINSLHTSPKTVVVVGAGYAIEVISCTCNYIAGGQSYNTNYNLYLGTGSADDLPQYTFLAALYGASSFSRGDAKILAGVYTNMFNGGDLILYVANGNPTGAPWGDGTAKIYVTYRIITL